ncbi:MAG: oligosaccharide flippase family protein [Pseudomonadota bacterium]|nr:oligosaccharide flippase family protein [Pseudomonadota bacterium]
MQFIVSVILARLLSASEIGVFSMTVVFVTIAHMFRDFGVSTYIQREADLTVQKMRSAIGVMFTTSWIIAVVLMAISAPLGAWFKEPGLIPVMRVLALGFIVIPFGSITHSMLTRQLAAEKQAYVMAISTAVYCISCLTLANMGFGTMSLAWANLINICVTALCYIPLRPKGMPWLPSFRHWGEIVHFGVGTLLTNCAQAVNDAIPDLVLGKLGNARLVGLLSRANSTVSIFNYVAGSTITYGAVSYLAQTHHRGESLVPVLRRASALLTGIGWPAFALTALLGGDIVVTLYGPKWLDCVPAILPLTIAAGLTMPFRYTITAFAAIGRPYLAAMPSVVTLTSRIAFGYWMFDGTLVTFAWSMCLATLVTAPVFLAQQRICLGFHNRTFFVGLIPSLVVTAICLAACEGMLLLIPSSFPPIVRLMVLLMPLVTVWYVSLRLTRHELVDEVHHMAAGVKARIWRTQ